MGTNTDGDGKGSFWKKLTTPIYLFSKDAELYGQKAEGGVRLRKTGHEEEKKVEYIELFFDLVFVYSLRTLNSMFHAYETEFPPFSVFFTFLFLIMALMQIWYFTTLFFNRYGGKTIRDYFSIFFNMYCIYYMASGLQMQWMQHYTRYHIAWAAILLNLALWNHHKMRTLPERDELDLLILKNNFKVEIAEAAGLLISIPIYYFSGIACSPFIMLAAFVFRGMEHTYYKERPVDFGHLSERALLLVVLTFGEMIIGIARYFEVGDPLYVNILVFMLVITLFLCYAFYYNNMHDHHRKTSGLWYLSLHVPLIMVINSITIILELCAEDEIPGRPKIIMLVALVSAYYILLLLIEWYAKPEFSKNRHIVIVTIALLIGYAFTMYLVGSIPVLAIVYTLIVAGMELGIMVHFFQRISGRRFSIDGYFG